MSRHAQAQACRWHPPSPGTITLAAPVRVENKRDPDFKRRPVGFTADLDAWVRDEREGPNGS